MTICGPFAVIHVLMNGSHHGGTRQRSDACFCEFLRFLCETQNIHPGGSQRQRYRQRYSAGCPLAPCGCRPSARVGALKNIQPSLMLFARLFVSLRYFS